MQFVGIDLSLTATGFLVLDSNGGVVHQEIISTNSKQLIEDRISYITNKILSSLRREDRIFIEGLSFGSQGNSLMELAGLHYYLRTHLKQKGFTFKVISPSSLKKFMTGKGNCKKDLVLLNVYKKFGVEFCDSNLADAYVLARMALEEFK